MWSKEWPTNPGCYWFYGWLFRREHQAPEMHFVRIKQSTTGVYSVTSGHFLHESEGEGAWQSAILPEPPKDFEEFMGGPK